MDLVLDLLRVLKIDAGDLQQSKIALAFLRGADRTFSCIASPKTEPPDLGR